MSVAGKISLSLVLSLWLPCVAVALSPSAAPQRAAQPVHGAGTTPSAAPSVRSSGLNSDLILEITGANRVVPPGGVVAVEYVLYSAEGNAGRIRLQVDLPDGWSLVDADLVGRDRLLEAWDIVKDELRLASSPDALVGPQQLIRLTAQMVDVPGVAEALTHVQVLNGRGLQLGSAHLSGTTALKVSGLNASGTDDRGIGAVVDLSGKLGRLTNIRVTYRQGPQESQSNHRYALEEKYFSGGIRHGHWNLQFGSQISSPGHVLTGPSVSGHGVVVRRATGPIFGEAVLAQPATFTGEGAGHLWRGHLGLRTSSGTIAVTASDFARPEGGYSTLPPVLDPTLDPDSLEDLERERELSKADASTRAQGLGLDVNLQLPHAHRVVLRGGMLRLHSAQAEESSAPSVEAQYSFSGRNATLNTRWRQAPPSVQGIYLPGNERSADGTLRFVRDLRLVARAYQLQNETVGEDYSFETQGTAVGLRYMTRRWRLDVSGIRRETHSSTQTLRQTGLISLGLPLGPMSFTASTELGEEETSRGLHPYRAYRGDLRWTGGPGLASLTVSSYESGGAAPRLRADVLTRLVSGEFEIAGGAWATRGWTGGGTPGMWLNLGVPVSSELTLLLGLEHAPPLLLASGSSWRFSLGIRTKLIIPLPFLRDGSAPREP